MECLSCSAIIRGKVCGFCGESVKDSLKKFQLKERVPNNKQDEYKEKARAKNQNKYNSEGI